jgi:AcrR family transcriptional regulator
MSASDEAAVRLARRSVRVESSYPSAAFQGLAFGERAAGVRTACTRMGERVKKSEQTRVALLEAAIDCLCDLGYHGLTVAKVAEKARQSRGCVRYYFADIQDIADSLFEYITKIKWNGHVTKVMARRDRDDAAAYAISLVGDPSNDRYRTARMELIVAARTIPRLQATIDRVTDGLELEKSKFLDQLFDTKDVLSSPNFRAASDISAVIEDWLFMQCLPRPQDERRQGVLKALSVALFAIWGAPAAEADGSQSEATA